MAPQAEADIQGIAKPMVSEVTAITVQPLKIRAAFAWGAGAVAAFHLAYELFPPAILLFFVCVYRLGRLRTRPQAMYAGWLLGLLIYGPQLAFFWGIFGFGALALWL